MAKSNVVSEGGALAFLSMVGVFGIPWFSPSSQWGWAGSAVSMVLFCVGIGMAINGRPGGLVIDIRNRVSLSKFQAAAWTVLVLSALIAAAIVRIKMIPASTTPPLDIDIPNPLLAAMAISATSLVATPLILNQKRNLTAVDGQEAETASKLGDDPANLASDGKLYGRNDPSLAQWFDMFRGDEVDTAGSPDLSKLQQFLVTVIILVAYSAAIWNMFGDSNEITSLPALSEHMTWLVGLSHAGYLAYKAAPHGATGDPNVGSAVG